METEKKIFVESVSSNRSNEINAFLLNCRIIAGAVRVGDQICLDFSKGIEMTIPIDEIEVLDGQLIQIKVHCEDDGEIDFLCGLNLSDQILKID